MNDFEFISGSIELIDSVQPLWEKLNKYHELNSVYFVDKFRNLKFEYRKNKLINENNLDMKIDLIKHKDKGVYIAYCISTISTDLTGEVDSILVDEEYRKCGLGDKLMIRAIDWLNNKQAKTITIGVAEGNEKALEFYKKYGFYKRRIILEQIN